ncbi:MAG: peptide deformylase [Monoraphidium minutum]|nr:MAG: peptide deformylase [Monoraphidium minutum]
MALRSRLLGAAAQRPARAAFGAAACTCRRSAFGGGGGAGSGAGVFSGAGAASSSGRAHTARAQKSAAGAVKEVPVADALEWTSPLQIIKYPDPRLRAANARVGAVDKQRLLALAAEMFELMYQDDGVGLAAPQVGVNVRLMVFNEHGPPARGGPSETVLVNPEIVARSRKAEVDEEGCLSFPKIYADVERAERIDVRYYDVEGQLQEKSLRGWVARIFQHEYDHLQGVLYHDRMKASELAKIRERIVLLEEAFVAANPGVAVQRLAPEGGGGGGSKGFGGGGGKGFGGGGGKGFGAARR